MNLIILRILSTICQKKINNEISLREESEKKRKQLILDISHDLKTPLTNILGYAETLLEDSNLSAAEKSVYLNIIDSNTKLSISVKESENTVKILIKDTGMGIDKNFHKTIFEPFVRTDTARNSKTGGTGLGLAITKKIIEKHGGTIKLNGYIEEGCEFIIELPKI